MKVVCGWCSRALGEKPGPAGGVSHGMCDHCSARVNAELDAADAEITASCVILDVERLIEESARLRRAA